MPSASSAFEPPTTNSATPDRDRPGIDATGRVSVGERALVLGGGGSTGNAWLIGIVAGIVVNQVGTNVDKGKWNAGKAQVQKLAMSIESYALDNGESKWSYSFQ